MTRIKARIPGTPYEWSYETIETLDITRVLAFLRTRGFTEVVALFEEIPNMFTCPAGPECPRGWFSER